MEKQYGKLILGRAVFELDDCEDTKLYIFESDEYEDNLTDGYSVPYETADFSRGFWFRGR